MSSNFMVYRGAARQLQRQGHLHRHWDRGPNGEGCGIRVLMDIAGFPQLDISHTSALQNPAMRLILTQLHRHLLDTSHSYRCQWEELLEVRRGKSCKRKHGFLHKKAKRHVPVTYALLRTAFVRWHDDDQTTLQEVVTALSGLAKKLEKQETLRRVMLAVPLWRRAAEAPATGQEHETEFVAT